MASEQRVEKKGGSLSIDIMDKQWQMPDTVGELKPYRHDVFELVTDNPQLTGTKFAFVGGDEKECAQYLRSGMRMVRRLN